MIHQVRLIRHISKIAIGAALLLVATLVRAESAWSETDVDLATLLQYEFKLVDSNFVMLPEKNQSIEVLYLQNGKKLFRCFTFETQGRDPKQWCETVRLATR